MANRIIPADIDRSDLLTPEQECALPLAQAVDVLTGRGHSKREIAEAMGLQPHQLSRVLKAAQ